MYSKLSPKLEELIREASARKASDFFLAPAEPLTLRIEGEIVRTETAPLSAEEIGGMAVAVCGKEELARIGAGVGFLQRSFQLPEDIYGAVVMTRSRGEFAISGRFFDWICYTAADLALPQSMRDAVLAPSGLVVFSGLAGSGKTTAALAAVDHVNSTLSKHIVTVQSGYYPIESKKSLVSQHAVGEDVPDILAGIHAAFRQDLDVLFVESVADVEELEACMTAAQTGHLVITAIHALSPEDAVQRLIDVFPAELRPVMQRDLAHYLVAVCAQQLLPRKPKGLLAAYGVLVPDDDMRRAIAEGHHFMERQGPNPAGCQTIADDIKRLHQVGDISDEIAKKALAEF